MKLRWMVVMSLVCTLTGSAAQAAEPAALATIPSEAVAFFCIPNPKAFDADVQSAIQTLGLTGMVPLPNNSVLQLAQTQLPALSGMNTEQPLIVTLMPGDTPEDMNNTTVVMIPSQDPEAMIQQLQGKQEGEQWTVTVMGRPLSARIDEGYLMLGNTGELLEKVESSTTSMQTTIATPVADGMEDLDLIVGLNVPALSDVIRPWLDEKVFPMLEQQVDSDFEKTSMELQRRQFDRLLEGLETVLVGLRLEEKGLAFRFVFGVKDGSEMSQMTHLAVTSSPLLKGLPIENWAVAAAQIMDQPQAEVQIKNLDELFSVYETIEGIDKQQLADVRARLTQWLEISRGYRMAVSPSDGDADGTFDVTVLASSEDSKKWKQLTGELFSSSKELLSGLDEEVASVFSAIQLEDEGDTMVFAVDLEQLDGLDDDQRDLAVALIGSDTSIRMQAINDQDVLVTLGGGAARLAALAKLADTAASSQHPGIQALADFLPTERNSVTYIFVDQCVELARKVLIAMDEDDLPFATPQVEAPITVTSTGGKNWSKFDVVVPLEVIAAGRDIGMTMMGRQ